MSVLPRTAACSTLPIWRACALPFTAASCAISPKPTMAASTLLKSWATPPARVPSASSLLARAICECSACWAASRWRSARRTRQAEAATTANSKAMAPAVTCAIWRQAASTSCGLRVRTTFRPKRRNSRTATRRWSRTGNSHGSKDGTSAACAAARAGSAPGDSASAPARRTPSPRNTAMRASLAGDATENAPSNALAGKAAKIHPPPLAADESTNRTATAMAGWCLAESMNGVLMAIASSLSRSSTGEKDDSAGTGLVSDADSTCPAESTSHSWSTSGMSLARICSARVASVLPTGRLSSCNSMPHGLQAFLRILQTAVDLIGQCNGEQGELALLCSHRGLAQMPQSDDRDHDQGKRRRDRQRPSPNRSQCPLVHAQVHHAKLPLFGAGARCRCAAWTIQHGRSEDSSRAGGNFRHSSLVHDMNLAIQRHRHGCLHYTASASDRR